MRRLHPSIAFLHEGCQLQEPQLLPLHLFIVCSRKASAMRSPLSSLILPLIQVSRMRFLLLIATLEVASTTYGQEAFLSLLCCSAESIGSCIASPITIFFFFICTSIIQPRICFHLTVCCAFNCRTSGAPLRIKARDSQQL